MELSCSVVARVLLLSNKSFLIQKRGHLHQAKMSIPSLGWALDTAFTLGHPGKDSSSAQLQSRAECNLHNIYIYIYIIIIQYFTADHLMSFWKYITLEEHDL